MYIDKDALVAEIESSIKSLEACLRGEFPMAASVFLTEQCKGRLDAYKNVLSLINALEIKEVDLEKHLKEDIEDVFFDLAGVAVKGATSYLTVEDVKNIAKYFFELGLNTKQTSKDVKIGETKIYLNDDGGEPPYDGKQWLDLSCTEYEIPEDKFKDGDKVELIIRKAQKGE